MRALLEKAVNRYPAKYLEVPVTNEVFSSIDECEERLIAFALSQGFDIVKVNCDKGRGIANFKCLFHGQETRNWRQLENTVERDDQGTITSTRRRNYTVVHQTGCNWACRVSFRGIGKRGSNEKGHILAVKCLDHHGHQLSPNPLVFPRHRERLDEFQALKTQARAHRLSVIPYSTSRRVLDSLDDFGLSLTSREYYNIVRIMPVDGTDEKSISGLLIAIQEAGFIYRTRVEEEVNQSGTVISKKLVQIWFTHQDLLDASARFVAGSLCVIDATFNTNKARLPIIVAVGILNNGRTFPIAFSYCRGESHEAYSFFWESLKEHWGSGVAAPAVILSDQAPAILSSINEQFPESQHQICEWHAVEAMCVQFRTLHTNQEIRGGNDSDGNEVEGLKDLAYRYIKSQSEEDLRINRQALYSRLATKSAAYIKDKWQPKERRVVRLFTCQLMNLGCHSSQRSESYCGGAVIGSRASGSLYKCTGVGRVDREEMPDLQGLIDRATDTQR